MITLGQEEEIWEKAENGDTTAMYALKLHYYNIAEPESGDESQVIIRTESINKRARNSIIAKCIILSLRYIALEYTPWTRQQSFHKEDKRDIYKEFEKLVETDNILAISEYGYLAQCYRNDNLGFSYLEKASLEYEPFSLLRLGIAYKEGKWKLNKNYNSAEYYLILASSYGVEKAKKELENLYELRNSSVSDSGCFITSAVCESFGYPDDCYELTMFREFRDNWLIKQNDGEKLIKEYYDIAPKIVNRINKSKNTKDIYILIWDKYLKKCLHFIEKKQYFECKALYTKMVHNLKSEYLY